MHRRITNIIFVVLALWLSMPTAYAQYYPPSGGGGGGSGTVTSVTFTGDGTVLSSTPSSAVTTSGTVTGALANAAAYTFLGNGTASSAAPTYAYGAFGATAIATTSGTVGLTVNSPTVQYLNSTLTGSFNWTLPQASTCPNKEFVFIRYVGNNANTSTVNVFSGDTIVSPATSANSPATTVTSYTFSSGNNKNMQILRIISAGGTQWIVMQAPILSVTAGGTGADLGNSIGGGGIVYGSSTDSSLACNTAGTSGQLLQSAGSGAPTWTSTPGSGTTLTTITATHQIAGGTVPTVAVGAGAGTGGSPAATITGHDTDFAVTLTMGTTTATGVIFTTTFGTAYASAPYVVITPANANAAAVTGTQGVYVTSGTGTMVLNSGTVGLTAAGASYIWNVHCGQ